MLNIVIFGVPGAGKGTQSKLFEKEMGLIHLSTGDMLRFEMDLKTELGEKIRKRMNAGEFVTDEQAAQLLLKNMNKHKNAKGFVFDGFPRTLSQTKILDELLKNKNEKINFAFFIDIPYELAFERIMKRAKQLGRTEDQNPEVVKKRFRIYREKTKPVIDFYKTENKLSIIEGKDTPEKVFEKIKQQINSIC